MRALAVGASGMLGRCLTRLLTANGAEVRSETAAEGFSPDVVFLTADLPVADRAATVRRAARAAADANALLVCFSTREVFGWPGVYTEEDALAPSTENGRILAETEAIVCMEAPGHLIIRTGDLFGWDRAADDIVQRIEQRLRAGRTLAASASIHVQPTLVDYLAEASLRLIQLGATGVVHVTGGDHTTELDFARQLARTLLLNPGLITDSAPGVPPRLNPRPGEVQDAPSPLAAAAAEQPTSAPLGGQDGEIAPTSLGRAGILPAPLAGEVVEEGGASSQLDITRLRQLLNTEPMPLGEAMKRLRRQWRADTYTGIAQPSVGAEADRVRREIFERVERYYDLVHGPKPFVPFESRINYSGRYFDATEMVALADSMLDFWLTLGPYGDLFEAKLRSFLGSRDVALVNSGSSANLVAISALASPLVEGHLEAGDEVITPAVTFPTTLAPLLQNQLIPVFVDCELGTYNVDVRLIEEAISPRTRALVIPHTLGNPSDLGALVDIAKRHNLFFVEDTCDALGATFDGRPVGTFGDLGTLSFYPAHHITMGEGGAVIVNRAALSRPVRAIRDWGRDCWCAPGESNTCARRFGWCLGELPAGYDHKYAYSAIGFNLKPTDMQAAIGAAQLDKLPSFVERRRHNFRRLYEGLAPLQDWLMLPTWHPHANPSWFGFPITVQGGVRRDDLVQWLEGANIETRLVFAGNILRQPGYQRIPHRLAGALDQSDRVMRDTFFIGVYPGITDEMADFMVQRIHAFFER